LEHLLPGLAAVFRAVDAALGVRSERVSEHGGEGDVGIGRVDDHRADLPLLLPDLRPGLAGVRRLVDAVARRDVAADVRLPRADVDHARVARRHGDRPDGGDRLVVEHRFPGDAAVLRFPDAARGGRGVVDERVSRHAGHARHAASAGGTDQPEFHPLELLRPLGGLVGVVGREADGGDGDNQREQQDDGPSDGSAATGQHGSLLTVWQGAAFYRQLAEGSIITAPGRYFIMGDGLMAENRYDAIVIGGGHNGLVSGAYFARSGARTVVLEARHKTGGAADTSAPFPNHPEIKVTTYSYVMSLMPPTIIRELKLKEFGYDVTPFGPYFQAFPDGRAITVYAD